MSAGPASADCRTAEQRAQLELVEAALERVSLVRARSRREPCVRAPVASRACALSDAARRLTRAGMCVLVCRHLAGSTAS